MRLHGLVNPHLNRAGIEAIVVVVAAAVLASIADVGDESLACVVGWLRQEDAAA
jgi:hypothetical protein